MIVNNRQEMAHLLNGRMNRTYSSLSERQQLETDTSLVKTYLIEAHLPESSEASAAAKLAEKIFSEHILGELYKPIIHKAEEESLISVEMIIKDEHIIIYVDYTNPRFWILHSLGSSSRLDWMIDRLIKISPELDRAWLSADLLEYISNLGSFRGLSLDYDRRNVPDVDFQAQDAPIELLKMQLWVNRAGDVLKILRESFPNNTTLSKVKIKFWMNGDLNGDFSLDDIKYDGKITARGTSFQSHIALISHIYEKYASKIRMLEENYALRIFYYKERLYLEGQPVNLLFNNKIKNLEIFCQSVFSCSEPFRLWGVPIQIAKDFYRVHAVDMHVGNPIQFEISPDFIRLYLPQGSCGNTIVRFYTNLQHYYDALVIAKDGDGRLIFEF